MVFLTTPRLLIPPPSPPYPPIPPFPPFPPIPPLPPVPTSSPSTPASHFPLAYLTPSLPHSLFPSFTPSSPHSCPRLLLRPPFLSPPPPPPSPRSEIMCALQSFEAPQNIPVTAIVTGVISLILAIGYLALVQLLDSRGLQMLPPPPEAFGP
ncbi:unnamed protein product [Closterium sp. NIES-65]|nr:unnamed protein product [Closterium sp. NIES-65]